MSIPLILGVLLVCGLAAGQLAARYDMPRVAAYVLTGVAFSPDLGGRLLGVNVNHWAEPLTLGALGIVAYLIGGSMTVGQLRRMGRTILGAALGESLAAVLLVFLAMYWLAPDLAGIPRLHLALAFAGIAATTAPAATVAVLHQFHARGPVSTTLLGVVALDDALGMIVFALVLVVVSGNSLALGAVLAVITIGGSVALGVVAGWSVVRYGRRARQSGFALPLLLGVILTVVGLAETLGLSSLLAAISLGFVTRYVAGAGGMSLSKPLENLEETVFIVFFTLAGAHFEMHLFLQYSGLAALYLVARVLGKIIGAALGARAVGAPPSVVRWLGPGLVPQAGVAVGLALSLAHHPAFQTVSSVILNAILATTIVYEIVGPLAARLALARAGELGMKRKKMNR